MQKQSSTTNKSQGALTVLGMGSCYALGTFTDNFYKQCVVLLAASLNLTAMQSYATVLFSLPFILFSAWAGWLADRIAKKNIVVVAKAIEMIALAIGAYMLLHQYWSGILLVLFFMGLQATFFSPALNGSIPENFTGAEVPRVNSFIKLASTAAVLAGIAIAGIFMDFRFGTPPMINGVAAKGVYFSIAPEALLPFGILTPHDFGRAASGIFIFFIAVIGLLVSFTLTKRPASIDQGCPKNPFPLAGPLDSIKHFFESRKDQQLYLVLVAESFFYGVAAIAVISISNLASKLHYSDTTTSLLSAALMVGIAIGAIIAGRRSADSWKTLLVPSALGMGIFLCATSFAPIIPFGAVAGAASYTNIQLYWLFFSLFLCGICGGIYLIPLASFIQVRPSVAEKGKILGVSNFMSFVAIALFGIAFYFISLTLEFIAASLGTALSQPHQFASAATFMVYGLCIIAFAWCYIKHHLPQPTK